VKRPVRAAANCKRHHAIIRCRAPRAKSLIVGIFKSTSTRTSSRISHLMSEPRSRGSIPQGIRRKLEARVASRQLFPFSNTLGDGPRLHPPLRQRRRRPRNAGRCGERFALTSHVSWDAGFFA